MTLQAWRDVAVVVMAVQGFVAALVVGAAVYFAIRGVLWLKNHVPMVTCPARRRLLQVEGATRRVGEAAVAPFVWLGVNWAWLSAIRRGAVQKNWRN